MGDFTRAWKTGVKVSSVVNWTKCTLRKPIKSEPCPQKSFCPLTIFFCACAERSFTSLVSAFQSYLLHHASQCCRRFGDLLFCIPSWRCLCAGRGCGVCRVFYDCSCETYLYRQSLQLKVLGASYSSFMHLYVHSSHANISCSRPLSKPPSSNSSLMTGRQDGRFHTPRKRIPRVTRTGPTSENGP